MQRYRDRCSKKVCTQKSRKTDRNQCFETHERSEAKKHPDGHSQSNRVLRILQSQELFALFPQPSNQIHPGEINVRCHGMKCDCARIHRKGTEDSKVGMDLVHRVISRWHTVGFKRVWMRGVSEEHIRCDT